MRTILLEIIFIIFMSARVCVVIMLDVVGYHYITVMYVFKKVRGARALNGEDIFANLTNNGQIRKFYN